MKKINGRTYRIAINKLKREVVLGVYPWGIYAFIHDKVQGHRNDYCSSRRFKFTTKCPTYADIVKRIESYYNITEKNII